MRSACSFCLFEGENELPSEGRAAAGSCLLACVGTLHSRGGKWLDVKQSVILEEMRISRDGLDHICSYEGRGSRREISDTAEYETQFADPLPPGTGIRARARPAPRPAAAQA